ncbi:hypothetical protein Q9966_015881 [Columba livia]|nr:hypothetical protein Q9966_015881 [Columba livia]
MTLFFFCFPTPIAPFFVVFSCAGFSALVLFLTGGCLKKVRVLTRSLNPFSTCEIPGKDIESFWFCV